MAIEIIDTEGSGPAFPSDGTDLYEGMSLRDYFAAHAPPEPDWFGDYLAERATYVGTFTQLVLWRMHYADAMLRARERK